MDDTRPVPPDPPDRWPDDPSVEERGRAFVRSTVVTWFAVIVLAIVFLAVIVGFAAS